MISSDEEVKEVVTAWFEEQSKDFFFPGGLSHCNKSGRSVLSYQGTTLKNKKYFFVINRFFLTQVDKLLNAPHIFFFIKRDLDKKHREFI